ncbi:hypothetical protein [Methanobacterium petrolearium]|uniref:hypothetical protein n=1 Tax=Methanobacterium petrolearium TaxID=710190 RepID=UPI001AE45416|nr:hypothetical protein [Methanobacterium petrolearium]MBP1945246.1 hypothetical protein [Methanobacterium petrolearium]BDZ71185.1 hypothetical protein GCM10025861_17020 [Methanobacterium petrolearium]
MDDKGFVFTADATLALVVVIVFTASVVVYAMLPVYQGQDHQHLQALADSALATMEQDGTLRDAAVYYANNDSENATLLLESSLNELMPSDVNYRLTMNGYSPTAERTGNSYIATDVATGVRIISGPKEGWLGRSFYNIKEVGLMEQDTNVTTTLWNFHNWLTNFYPWSGNRLDDYPYWGSNGQSGYWASYQTIDFSVPNATSINWAKFIINSAAKTSYGSAYSAGTNINGHNYYVAQNRFQYLYSYSSRYITYRFYNNMSSINPSNLIKGDTNSLYVHYTDVNSYNDMAWFSLIANYTVSMVVPQGVVTKSYYFDDAAGLAYPNPSSRPYYPDRVSGITYNLNTGDTSSFTANSGRRISWNNYINYHPNVADGTPFVLVSPPGGYAGSAIAIEKDIDNTDAGTIKDAYLVMNPYGAADGARVEVYHPSIGGQPAYWETVFSSNVNTQYGTDSGYGNLPGIINLKGYMDKGYVNKVRITIWDNVPQSGSVDYDLVGLTNCYIMVSSSKLPIWWDEYATVSDQSRTNQISKDITYEVRSNQTKDAYLFFSGGLDTKNVKVAYTSGEQLYDGSTPYLLNLGELDAAGPQLMTNGTVANHTYIPGNYSIRVTVTSGEDWESGDGYAEIYSGTRVAVIYPALEHAVWTTSYAPTAQEAIDEAYQQLLDDLHEQGFYDPDPDLFYNESMYTGDLPNSIPVRLDLWTY